MKKKSVLVNYDTQWTNKDLTNQLFYFKAGIPIEEITLTLETKLNSRFKENYQTPSAHLSFNRLYRNIIPQYKGWQVLY